MSAFSSTDISALIKTAIDPVSAVLISLLIPDLPVCWHRLSLSLCFLWMALPMSNSVTDIVDIAKRVCWEMLLGFICARIKSDTFSKIFLKTSAY